MPVRLKDIAKRANVSLQAVSVVVNRAKGSSVVGNRTSRRILRVARELGYIPHAGARSIRKGAFRRVACVFTRVGPPGQPHAVETEYLDTAAHLLALQGYLTIFEPFYLNGKTLQFYEAPRLFSELTVDGILGFDTLGEVPDYVDERLAELHAPVVWINRTPKDGITCVNIDEGFNSRLIVRHLLELGHRRIGYVGIGGPHYSSSERFDGVVAELRAAGFDTSGLYLDAFNKPVADVARRMLDHRPAYTAMICYSAAAVNHLFRIALEFGLRIPKDLSVAYFTSPAEVRAHDGCLGTAVHLPETEIVQTALDLLMEKIRSGNPPATTLRFPGKLVVGTTTTPPDPLRNDTEKP